MIYKSTGGGEGVEVKRASRKKTTEEKITS